MTWKTFKNAILGDTPQVSTRVSDLDIAKLKMVEPVTRKFSGYKTCLYFGQWSIYSNHTPKDVNLSLATNIFYSFFNIDPNTGEVLLGDPWADIQKPFPSLYEKNVHYKGLLSRFYEIKHNNRNVKVSMSIGGWSNKDNFACGLANTEKLTRFVQTAIDMMMKYGFDGIDLDWEYPSNPKEATIYLTLVRQLRYALRQVELEKELAQDTFLLTMACPAYDEKLDLLDINDIDQYLSFWNMMTYDFSGEWSSIAGYHCNLYKTKEDELCADDAIKYMIKKGVDSRKLILGMAMYGRPQAHTEGYGFKAHGVPSGTEDGCFMYNKLPLPGCKELYNRDVVSAYCYSAKDKVFCSYDNVESVRIKAIYVRNKRLGGGMFWESRGDLRQEHRSLLASFVKGVGGVQALENVLNVTGCYTDSEFTCQFPVQYNIRDTVAMSPDEISL